MTRLISIALWTFVSIFCNSQPTGKAFLASQNILINAKHSVDTTIKFQYRDILEDYIDSISSNNIKNLFGTWTITSIAQVGGTMEDEELIQSQIGHKLLFDNNALTFTFLKDTTTLTKPLYSIKYFNEENGDNMRGTSLFFGYRSCRKSAIMLDVSERLYFEIIHFREITYYYDGRIYFLTRLK